MKQFWIVFISFVFVGILFGIGFVFRSKTGVDTSVSQNIVSGREIEVVASFYPLGEFARQVGGDNIHVSIIVPSGVEPHDYEPTPQDIALVHSADVVIANGAGLDSWLEKIRPELEASGVSVLVMSQSLGFDANAGLNANQELGIDPHFWLDPVLARQEIGFIKDIFVRVDTEHQNIYNENAMVYEKQLQDLYQSYQNGLAACGMNTVITSHDVLEYVAKEYQFKALSIAGISPESEPSTRQLADLATLAKQNNIKHIFFETLVSPRLAQTLADEVGAKILVFNPLEGLTHEEINQGENYISVMKQNLQNLRTAMDCK